MPQLLRLDSSADLTGSRSRAITQSFVEAWVGLGPDFTVTTRDLHRQPVPHLADATLHWAPRLRLEGQAPPPPEAEKLQDELIAELLAADVVVVGAPMYNYSLPSALKAWIDHIHVLGVTAPFDRPTQPMAGRTAVIAASQGVAYEDGTPTAGWDHAGPVLELILGKSLGMTTTTVAARYTLADRVPALKDRADQSRAELDAARARAAELATEIGRAVPAAS